MLALRKCAEISSRFNAAFNTTADAARRLPAWIAGLASSPLLCGYDADFAGDQAALALHRQHPHLRRLRPQGAKDWNDLLRLLAR